jgi:hypothetical protein
MARGGSRYGAGRPAHRIKSEHVRSIDIRRWHREGYLILNRSFSWCWRRGDEATGSIGVSVQVAAVDLSYGISTNDQWRDCSQRITFTFTACHLGGQRRWFSCPVCASRACVLYLRWSRFACRRCQRVSYQSQSGSAIDRVCRRFHKLEALVEAPKPKWQRWRTRNALLDRYDVSAEKFDVLLAERLRALGCPI